MKHLTARYSLTQFTFWASATGAASFATTYLLKNGLSSGTVGILLAVAGILSCVAQPMIANLVDRSRTFRLPGIMAGASLACAVCYGIQLFPGMSVAGRALCYMTGIFLSNCMIPLLNALCVSYEQAGYSVNFGIARGIGSCASALSSLVLGNVLAQLGNQWMLLILVAFRLGNVIVLLGYAAISKPDTGSKSRGTRSKSRGFVRQYPWYCATLLGVLFLGMYHAMTENYMIAILERLGGNSSHVGTALFLSSMAGAGVIFCFRMVRSRLSDNWLLRIAAGSFLVKSICIFFAGNIPAIYGIQLLQMTSYAFLEPTLVYYAQSSVHRGDMVKGQAFSTAAYAFGCAGGNFLGGQLLNWGVPTMLAGGILMALVGTLLIGFTVQKTDMGK